MNLFDYLLDNASETDTALIQEGRHTTYGDMNRLANTVARELMQAGMGFQQKIGILAENSPFWAASYLGILKAGGVAVPLPARLSTEELSGYIKAVGCRIVCLDNALSRKYADSLPSGGLLLPKNEIMARAEKHTDPVPTVPVNPFRDLAALMFTSGSTGQPNAVKVTHRNVQANTDSIIAYIGLEPSDRMMAILPFHYCFGTSLLHTHLRAGGSLVLNNYFQYIEDMLNEMESCACTGFAGVPSSYQALLGNRSFRKRTFPALRHVQQAGGRLADHSISELRSILPERVKIHIGYGQTEATARLSALPSEKLLEKNGSIGKGIPGVTLQVVGKSGEPVRPGETGEIVAEGENVTAGYLFPDPAQDPFREGKLYTGDLARIDTEGYIYIAGRAKEFIKPSGYKIMTATIEQVLLEVPEITEAAVIGVPHEQLGEAAKAFVVPKDKSVTTTAILEYCKTKLPAYAVPSWVEFRDGLPKNSAGKIIKAALHR